MEVGDDDFVLPSKLVAIKEEFHSKLGEVMMVVREEFDADDANLLEWTKMLLKHPNLVPSFGTTKGELDAIYEKAIVAIDEYVPEVLNANTKHWIIVAVKNSLMDKMNIRIGGN